MKSIWKFFLSDAVEQTMMMPQGAQIISCQYQDNHLCIWAIIDLKAVKVKRKLMVQGTGWEHDGIDKRFHVATVQQGPFVWHVFDMGEE